MSTETQRTETPLTDAELERIDLDTEDYAWRDISAFARQLETELSRLRLERDEADRRAGAAERKLEWADEGARARNDWLDKAKEKWGVHRNISFDVVWKECLALKAAASDGTGSTGEGWRGIADVLPKLGPNDESAPVFTFDGKTVREDEFCGIWDMMGALGAQKVDEWFDLDEHSRNVTHWMPRKLPAPPLAGGEESA